MSFSLGGTATSRDSHFVATSAGAGKGLAGDYPWHDLEHWLASMGMPQYAAKFKEHDITGKEMPFLKETHLIDMGINVVGDRLRILQMVEAYLRGLRNRQRQMDILVFRSWSTMPFADQFKSKYHVSESAIVVKTPHPLFCSVDVDNVDISSITDIKLETGIYFSEVVVYTTDPSVLRKGGKLKFWLTNEQGAKVHKTIKNLVEEDKIKLGRTGGAQQL